jgi:hypothetical protein
LPETAKLVSVASASTSPAIECFKKPSNSIIPAENLVFQQNRSFASFLTPSDQVCSYPNNDQTDDPPRRSKTHNMDEAFNATVKVLRGTAQPAVIYASIAARIIEAAGRSESDPTTLQEAGLTALESHT